MRSNVGDACIRAEEDRLKIKTCTYWKPEKYTCSRLLCQYNSVLLWQLSQRRFMPSVTVLFVFFLPSRTEPVEAEMLSDRRCSRKRGKKLLLKWQWKTCKESRERQQKPGHQAVRCWRAHAGFTPESTRNAPSAICFTWTRFIDANHIKFLCLESCLRYCAIVTGVAEWAGEASTVSLRMTHKNKQKKQEQWDKQTGLEKAPLSNVRFSYSLRVWASSRLTGTSFWKRCRSTWDTNKNPTLEKVAKVTQKNRKE